MSQWALVDSTDALLVWLQVIIVFTVSWSAENRQTFCLKTKLAKTRVEQTLRKRTIIPVRRVLESETENLSISGFQFSKLLYIDLTFGLMVVSNGEHRQAASLDVVIWAPVICVASPSVPPHVSAFIMGTWWEKWLKLKQHCHLSLWSHLKRV